MFKTSYLFYIMVKFDQYPDEDDDNFTYQTDQFWIRDYCAGMTFSTAPILEPQDSKFLLVTESTQLDSELFLTDPGLAGETEEYPWVFSLTKNLYSSKSTFKMPFVHYKKYWDPAVDIEPEWDEGCQKLKPQPLDYVITGNSHEES